MGNRKRKKGYYIKSAKGGGKKAKVARNLEAGMRGFLITCNKTERQAVIEAYSILNEYADKLYGPEQNDESQESEDEDIEAAISKQVEQLKQANRSTQRRFQAVETGTKSVVFINTTVDNPATITDQIFKDLCSTKKAKSRHIMKLIPVIVSCKATTDKLQNFALEVLDSNLKGATDFTYGLDIKIRNNGDIKAPDIMRAFTQAMTDLKPAAKVKLTGPDYLININVLRRVLCVSILTNFVRNRKYNLQQIVAVAVDDDKPENENEISENDNEKPEHENEKPENDNQKPEKDTEKPEKDDENLEKDNEKHENDNEKSENDDEKVTNNGKAENSATLVT